MDPNSIFTLDALILILSTDWFFPYWSGIRINVSANKRKFCRDQCRQIVQQIVSEVPSGGDYYSRSFSNERVAETSRLFRSLMDASGITDESLAAVDSILGSGDQQVKASWLLGQITEAVVTKTMQSAVGSDDSVLDTKLIIALAQVWDRNDWDKLDFEELNLASVSDWDRYIRSLTPDLPTYLSDFLLEKIDVSKFDYFWSQLQCNLTSSQRQELIEWYGAMALKMTGRRFDLSYLDRFCN